jgi:uncharacterized protein YndB with AHSA1/START domain
MDAGSDKNTTTVERRSDRELCVRRHINGPARIVFAAWTKPELMKQWWCPKQPGVTLVTCEVDARVGGKYRMVFDFGGPQTMTFFGKYLEVVPPSRLVWTNEETKDGPITTATFEEQGGKTLIVLTDLYPTKEALDAAMANGATEGLSGTLEQLEDFIATQLES